MEANAITELKPPALPTSLALFLVRVFGIRSLPRFQVLAGLALSLIDCGQMCFGYRSYFEFTTDVADAVSKSS